MLCRQQSVLPEILEPIGSHFGVPHRVHDVLVAHVVLERPGIVPVVGELIARRMPQHMRMDRKWELGGFSGPGDRFEESRSRGRTAALGDEDVARFHILTAKLSQNSDFPAAQGMHIIDPALGSADV